MKQEKDIPVNPKNPPILADNFIEIFQERMGKGADILCVAIKALYLVPVGIIFYVLLVFAFTEKSPPEINQEWLLIRDFFNYLIIIFLICIGIFIIPSNKESGKRLKKSLLHLVGFIFFLNFSWMIAFEIRNLIIQLF